MQKRVAQRIALRFLDWLNYLYFLKILFLNSLKKFWKVANISNAKHQLRAYKCIARKSSSKKMRGMSVW